MSEPCPCQSPNPLVRDGTSQSARALPALDPAWAPVDGRDTAAYLEYLRGYAKILQYYDPANQRAGDWAPFIERDVSSVAAAVAAQDAERESTRLQGFADEVTRPAGGRVSFRRLLDRLFALALRLDGWAVIGAEELRFPEVLRREVYNGLRADLLVLIGIYKGAASLGLLAPSPAGTEVTAEQVLEAGLGTDWWPPEAIFWGAFVGSVPANFEAFGAEALPELERLARALEYLRPLARSFPRALARMAEEAAEDLRRTLTDWPQHEPPMALLLAFLHLFRYALDSLNGLTARHLEYYFQEVLRLRPREGEADRVFITFELARHLESFVVPAGTVLLGGKDDQGRPLRYALEGDLRVDHTTVGPFMAVHRSPQGVLAASPTANSADGLGAALPAEQPGWPAFGSATHPAASLGFALSSPVLLLSEGERVITVELTLSNPLGSVEFLRELDPSRLFQVELSTAKGWFIPPVSEVRLTGDVLRLVLWLTPKDEPVTPYQRDVHGGSLETAWPVCRFFLKQDEASGRTYGALSSLMLPSARVDVQVSGVQKLQVETDAGSADPAKPFQPFGAQPLPGSAFSVKYAELAPKALSLLELELQWMEPAPGLDLSEIYAGYTLEPPAKPRKQGNAEQAREAVAREESPASAAGTTGQVTSDTFRVEVAVGLAPDPAATAGSVRSGGLFKPATFNIPSSMLSPGGQRRPIDTLRVRLTQPLHGFGHRLFPRLHAQAVMTISRLPEGTSPLPSLPHPPVTPTLAGLTLTYGARANFVAGAPAQAEERFFHLHPFGATRESVGSTTPWLPSHPHEGELFIGLGDTGPQRRISLLFQLEEGSGDPLLDAAQVMWSYLDADQRFHVLPAEALGDGTGGLVRSGLVSVLLPPTAANTGGRLPEGRFWLRASVPERTAATCRMIAVHPQAASAVLLNAEQHPTHLSRALPAGTVSKLEQRQVAIKKLHQPVASLGGRAPEAPLPFARRASERLRHKQRAITPHDYETLVLEAFPSLYKVKCLNHTRLDATTDREISPGSVTVVAVPNLIGRTGHNPFTPYTSQATLAAVADFLRPLVGPFVKLQVKNPTYEPIRLGFTVKFKPGHDDPALSIARLKQEINAYLSPWAFAEGADIVFGGAIHRSTLLHFVERRPYVDFVTDFRVTHLGGDTVADEDRLVARTSRSILVSAGDHDILPEPVKELP
ncbi:MAG: hypothetical protein JXB05_33000 [Myxococcaceae bacterium]|nr:hypothetical protein [Myxococcaceae bacterium]